MFFDEVHLEVSGGRGGNGMVSFMREKFIPYGPPDGGDGGNGGSVDIESDPNYNTLRHFLGRKHFSAEDAKNGHTRDKAGPGSEYLVLKVPVGTLVYNDETGELLHDFQTPYERFRVARGGRGGYGNANFSSSVRQAPQFAELGDIGEHLKIRLELQLVAHVGLLGFPSAGKSTLISHISAAKPKIGDYPFTTLVPNLGVVDLSRFGGDAHQSFVVADLPGLIEGASEGKGLGVRFLKHVSRTAVLLYVLDPFSYDNMTIEKQFEILGHELKNYDAELSKKTFWVAINKVDSIPEDDQKSLLKTFLKKFPKLKTRVQFISAITGTGLKELVFQLHKMVREEENKVVIAPPPADEIAYVPKFFVDEQGFSVALEGSKKLTDLGQVLLARSSHEDDTRVVQILRVKGARIEQIARMTNPEHDEGVERVYDVMKKMGIMRALVRAGIAFGDVIAVGPLYLEYHEL